VQRLLEPREALEKRCECHFDVIVDCCLAEDRVIRQEQQGLENVVPTAA